MPNSPSLISSPVPALTSNPIRVLCIDDSRDITELLGQCVEHQPDMESVGSLSTANNLRAELEKSHPDVVLLDMSMPGDDPLVALATQLMAKDALTAHARDELGFTEELSALPVQAAFASAGTFTVGAALPLLLVLMLPKAWLVSGVSAASLVFLALLGSLAARAGGSTVWKSAARLTFWGALAMGLTAGVGALFGARL